MAFGQNSGVVSGGIGSGFASGAENFSRNYQEAVRQDYEKKRDNRNALQTALGIKVQAFRDMRPPEPPSSMDPTLWEQWVKDNDAWYTARVQTANDIDALMKAYVGAQKNPDGTPIETTSFSKIALGTDPTQMAAVLGERTKKSTQLSELTKQLDAKQQQLVQVVQVGGTEKNPEYDRLKGEIDALQDQIKGLYKDVTGVEYTGRPVDYAALNTAAQERALSDTTRKVLTALAPEDATIQAILAAASDKPINFNTKLTALGFNDNRTVGEVFRSVRGAAALEQAVAEGDVDKAVTIYAGLKLSNSPELDKSKAAQGIEQQLQDPNSLYSAAWKKQQLPLYQAKNLETQTAATQLGVDQSKRTFWNEKAEKGQLTPQEFSAYQNERRAQGYSDEDIQGEWSSLQTINLRKRVDIATQQDTNANNLQRAKLDVVTTLGEMARQGNPTVLTLRPVYEDMMRQLNPKVTDGELDTGWASVVDKYEHRTERDNADLALAKNAVEKGTLENNEYLTQMINNGSLFVLDSVGMSDDVKKMYTSKLGEEEGTRRYNQAVTESEARYNFVRANEKVDLETRQQNLLRVKKENEWNELTKTTRLRILKNQDEAGRLELEYARKTLSVRVAQERYDYFAKGAQELGSAWLTSPNVKALAKEMGVDLSAYSTVAEFSDWARGDRKRQSALNEFLNLVQNPRIAVTAPQSVRRLAGVLGLDYNKLMSNLHVMATNATQMDAAQLNSIITNTWATKKRVGIDAAELNLRKLQQQWGMKQDTFNNTLRIVDGLRSNRQFALQLNAQDRQTLATYAGTLQNSIVQAGQIADDAERKAEALQSNPYVAPSLGTVKEVNGVFIRQGSGPTPTLVQEYIDAKNAAKNARAMQLQGLNELNELKNLIKPSANNSPNSPEMELYGQIFGESGFSFSQMNFNLPGGSTPTLNSAFREAVKNLPGAQGKLVQAAVASLDGGLVDPRDGKTNLAYLPERCSAALRALSQRIGVDASKYFGGTARATWQLLQKNGQVLNGGKPLSQSAFKTLQPGDILYLDLPNNNVDHVAMYIGNGLVYQHNSAMKGTTGAAGGYLNVVPLDKFVKLAPTYAARVPEVGGSAANNTTQRPTKSNTSNTAGTNSNTSNTAGKNTNAVVPKGAGTTNLGGVDYYFPPLPKGKYRANVSRVNNFDLLAVPTGNGLYNLVTDTNTARSIAYNINMQLVKNVDGYLNKPLADRKNALVGTMRKMGYAGNLERLADMVLNNRR